MTLKHVSKLTTRELDYAVGIAEGLDIEFLPDFGFYGIRDKYDPIAAERIPSYSTEWRCGGPLIDEYKIDSYWHDEYEIDGVRYKNICECMLHDECFVSADAYDAVGETMLITTCRAVIAFKLGEYVEVPDDINGD